MQSKVVNLLDTNFDAINDMIEKKFNEIRESHQKDKEEIILAIQNKNQNEIDRLTRENSAKDAIIYNLKQKEGQLDGKEELIASLNLRIN